MQNTQNLNKLYSVHGYKILNVEINSDLFLPFFSSKVPAGFPSPADDYIEDKIDLNDLATKNSPAAFIVRVKGNSMVDAGIKEGDYLVVDRSIDPADGKIIVVAIDGNVTVKKLQVKNGKGFLLAANPKFPSIEINENNNVEIFGVVVSVVHFF